MNAPALGPLALPAPPAADVARGSVALTAADRARLDATLDAFEGAAAWACDAGRQGGTAAVAVLHHRCYHDVRARFGLPANLAVRAIAVAARRLREPDADGLRAIEYDPRVFRLDPSARTLDLATLAGRLRGLPLTLTEPDWAPVAVRGVVGLQAFPSPDGTYAVALRLRPAGPLAP